MNKNAKETEQAARSLFAALRSTENQFTINATPVYILTLLTPEPVDIGTDDNGVYEWVIEFEIYYERK